MSTELTKTQNPQNQLITFFKGDEFKAAVSQCLPKHCTPDRFLRVALSAFNRTPKLMQCTKASLLDCFMQLSTFGLEPDGRRAHLIPYGDKCTLIIDYKGLVELIMRSGEVSNIHADIVCQNDAFKFDLGQITKHMIDFKKPRGEMYAAYAVATLKDGNRVCQVLSKEEIDDVRKRSRSGNSGPWVTDYNEMAKKTAFRRLSKWLPLSPELREAVERDDDAIDIQSERIDPPKANPFALLDAQRAEEPAPEIEQEQAAGNAAEKEATNAK